MTVKHTLVGNALILQSTPIILHCDGASDLIILQSVSMCNTIVVYAWQKLQHNLGRVEGKEYAKLC